MWYILAMVRLLIQHQLSFGKTVNDTCYRNAFMCFTETFIFFIGDYGNTKLQIVQIHRQWLTQPFSIPYSAPA